jgi:hypothetical protein
MQRQWHCEGCRVEQTCSFNGQVVYRFRRACTKTNCIKPPLVLRTKNWKRHKGANSNQKTHLFSGRLPMLSSGHMVIVEFGGGSGGLEKVKYLGHSEHAPCGQKNRSTKPNFTLLTRFLSTMSTPIHKKIPETGGLGQGIRIQF